MRRAELARKRAVLRLEISLIREVAPGYAAELEKEVERLSAELARMEERNGRGTRSGE